MKKCANVEPDSSGLSTENGALNELKKKRKGLEVPSGRKRKSREN
jgi:hypothetical protein